MFGIASIFAYLGGGLAHVIPGYLPATTFNYLIIMTSIAVPYFIFAMIVAFVIREPLMAPPNMKPAQIGFGNMSGNNAIANTHVVASIDENNSIIVVDEDNNTNETNELNLTHLNVWDDDLHDTNDVYDSNKSSRGVKTSLVATIMRCVRNTPFLILFGIMLCTRGYFFSDIFIYKYYCKASNADIATLEIVAYSVRVFSSSFWCYISGKVMKNRNHRYTITASFIIFSISYILYAFVPYDLKSDNKQHEFLTSPIVWIQSILYNLSISAWGTVSPNLLAMIVDFDEYLWPNMKRKEAIYQGLLNEGIQIDGVWKLFNSFGAIPILYLQFGCYLSFQKRDLDWSNMLHKLTMTLLSNILTDWFPYVYLYIYIILQLHT